jgi:hypothetical protein
VHLAYQTADFASSVTFRTVLEKSAWTVQEGNSREVRSWNVMALDELAVLVSSNVVVSEAKLRLSRCVLPVESPFDEYDSGV